MLSLDKHKLLFWEPSMTKKKKIDIYYRSQSYLEILYLMYSIIFVSQSIYVLVQ